LDARTIAELETLTAAAREAADRYTRADDPEAVVVYQQLRARAARLNREQGWAESEEFDTLFPTLEAQREIDALDDQYRTDATRPREPGAPVQRLLRHLSAWMTGLLMGKTLEEDAETGSE
jgi:hypothetical protein